MADQVKSSMEGDDMEKRLLNSIQRRFKDSGIFQQIKCQLRAKVLEDIRCADTSTVMNNKGKVQGDATCPIEVACSLINEFLEWMGFQYTKEMFATESGVSCSNDLFKMKVSERYQNFQVDEELPSIINIISNLIKCDDDESKGKKDAK